MLQGPALGRLLECLGSVLGGLCCTLPPLVVQNSVVLRTGGLQNNLLFLHRSVFIKWMSHVSCLCLFLTGSRFYVCPISDMTLPRKMVKRSALTPWYFEPSQNSIAHPPWWHFSECIAHVVIYGRCY